MQQEDREAEATRGPAKASAQAGEEPRTDVHDGRKRLAALLARGVLRVLSRRRRGAIMGGAGDDSKAPLVLGASGPS